MIVLPPTALTRMSMPPNSLAPPRDQRIDLGLVERVAEPAVRPPAGGGDLGDGLLQPLRIVVDADDRSRLRAP